MIKNIQIIIFLFFTSVLFAQKVNFKTEISRTSLGLNERLRIVFSFDKQGADNFQLPNFKNFKVVSGPFVSTNFIEINGNRSVKVSYTFMLEPLKKGRFTIPEATASYNGKVIKSNTVKVQVTKPIEIPLDPNDPKFIATQNIHVVAEVSNTKPYVGESISVVYKIYVNVEKTNVRDFRETKSPTFDGFWNQDINTRGFGVRDGTYKGKPVRYTIIKKSVLIPQKSGKLTINPLQLNIAAKVLTGLNFMGEPRVEKVSYEASTGKQIINVKPLPENGKPANFSGAVGDFNFSVTSNKTEIKANESAQIKVLVSGKGNLKLIDLPSVETPEGLEKYEPKHKDKVRTTLGGTSGSVYDEYTIVPQFKGKYKIPPLEFSYFSLKDKKYKTIKSEPIFLNSLSGIPLGNDNTQDIANTNKETTNSVFKNISNTTSFSRSTNDGDFFGSKLFYTLLLLPLLAIPIVIVVANKKQARDNDIEGNKRRKADRLARKYLSEAEKQLGNKEAFYIALEKALHNYLKAKLQVETFDISKDKIYKILESKNVNTTTILEFIKVLDDCDYARYTPTTNIMMKQEYENAKRVIIKIDKEL